MKQEVRVTLSLEAEIDLPMCTLEEVLSKAIYKRGSKNTFELMSIMVESEAEIYGNE